MDAGRSKGAPSGGQTSTEVPEHQSAFELAVERAVILVVKAFATGLGVYLVLVAFFFMCCGTGIFSYTDPARSPFGPIVTIVVVWPVAGLLCVVGGDALGEGIRLLPRLFRRR
jgi:hypothetical protein